MDNIEHSTIESISSNGIYDISKNLENLNIKSSTVKAYSNGIYNESRGYIIRGGREMEAHFETLWDLFRSIPTLENCGGCDIPGEGGSLKMMQTGAPTMDPVISAQKITQFPSGVWKTECLSPNNSEPQRIYLTVNQTEAYRVHKYYYDDTSCTDETKVTEIKAYRFTFNSMGTASDRPNANTLHVYLNQVISEPYNSTVANQLMTCTSFSQTAVVSDGSKAYDISQCFGIGSYIGVLDNTARFYTNGLTLSLWTSEGTFNFTR
jgi:hypothetical protein